MPSRRSGWNMPPSEVPGYAEAGTAGLLPGVPSTPPRLMVVPTAQAALRTFIATFFGGGLTAILFGKVLGWVGAPDGAIMVVVGLGGTLLLVLILRLLARIGDQLVAEIRHGYTTLENFSGGFWTGQGHTDVFGRVRGKWDFRGLWLLDGKTGAVRRPPTPGGLPPGMYPSPHRPGQWELWTGVHWMDHYGSPADHKSHQN